MPTLARPERGRELERFVFVVSYGERSVTLVVRDGIIDPEFIDLVRTEGRNEEQKERLEVLKAELAERTHGRRGSRRLRRRGWLGCPAWRCWRLSGTRRPRRSPSWRS